MRHLLARLKRAKYVDLLSQLLTLGTHNLATWPQLDAPLQPFARVLVLAAHPDDEAFGMGGTLLRMVHRGVAMRIRWLTNGENDVRVREGLAVTAALGLTQERSDSFPLPGPQLLVHEGARVVAAEIASFAPDLICTPSLFDGHPDHLRVAVSLATALRAGSFSGSVLQYEVWSTVVPNVLVDLSPVMAEKERLMRIYVSQLGEPNRRYVERTLALNRYRGLTYQIEGAEGFVLASRTEFLRLCGALPDSAIGLH